MKPEKTPIALITGGSSGIGLAISKELAQKGYNILIISDQQKQLDAAKELLEARFKVQFYFLNVDLSKEGAAQVVFDYCQEKHFRVDILINNAGELLFAEALNAELKRVSGILQLHVLTPTMLCRLFGEEMKERKNGHILNVSSISTVMPYPGISLYGPSKVYLKHFSRAFRSEMKIHNVNVSALFPGATETGLFDPNRINFKLAKNLRIMHTAEYVANKAVKGMFSKKSRITPGMVNKLAMCFLPLLPAWVPYMLHKKTNLVKIGSEALD